MNLLAAATVSGAGIYLVGLGVAALFRPGRAKSFLAGFASSARTHYAELVVRLIVGVALVVSAPRMRVSALVLIFGYVLVATTVGMFAVPWRLHNRFAAWSVPIATRNMPLFALGSIVGGACLLASLLLGRSAT